MFSSKKLILINIKRISKMYVTKLNANYIIIN